MKAVILILNVTVHFLTFHKCLIYTSYIPTHSGPDRISLNIGGSREKPPEAARYREKPREAVRSREKPRDAAR